MSTTGVDKPVDRARALGPLLEESGTEIERERRLPKTLLDAMFEARLFRLLIPRAYGGEEAEPIDFAYMMEEVARHDASTAWCLGQMSVCAMASAFLEPEVAMAVFGDARSLLAWGTAVPPPSALETEGGYRVSGAWSFASGSHHATWLGGHSFVTAPDGTPRLDDAGKPVPRTLLFQPSEVEWTDIWDVIGLNGTGSDRYAVEELFVPQEFTLNREDFAERRVDGRLYRFRTDQMYAIGFASVALGIARGMLDAYVALAAEKTPRGYPSTLAMSAVTQCDVAELEARLRSARAYLFDTAGEAWSATRDDELPIEHRMAIRLAATHCIREARRIAGDAYSAGGTTSVFSSNPFERRLRDSHSVSQQMHGRRSHFETVGKYLLGIDTDTSFL